MVVHSRMWSWLPFIAAEASLYLSYRQNDGRFHWFLHFFVGASAALIVMALMTWRSGRIDRYPLLWIFVGHVVAMFPDILWNFLVRTHEPWMDGYVLGAYHRSLHSRPELGLVCDLPGRA